MYNKETRIIVPITEEQDGYADMLQKIKQLEYDNSRLTQQCCRLEQEKNRLVHQLDRIYSMVFNKKADR